MTDYLALLREALCAWPDSLCDVGCGQGWHLEALSDVDPGSFWGIEVSGRSLERFAHRTNKIQSGKVRVVLGDVRDWQCTRFFGVVTSFVSCLGEFSDDGDRPYFHSLTRPLKSGGLLLTSVFCEDMTKPLLGRWTASYSKSDPRFVSTVVSYDKTRRLLEIAQAWDNDTRVVPTETMRLYRCDDLRALAESAGFVSPSLPGLDQRRLSHGRLSCDRHCPNDMTPMMIGVDQRVERILYQQQHYCLMPGIARGIISKCLRLIESVKFDDWKCGDDSVHSWRELSGPSLIDLDAITDANVLSGILGAEVRASFQWINVYKSCQYIPTHRDAAGDAHLLACISVPPLQDGGQLWLAEESRIIPLGPGDALLFKAARLMHAPIQPGSAAVRMTLNTRLWLKQ